MYLAPKLSGFHCVIYRYTYYLPLRRTRGMTCLRGNLARKFLVIGGKTGGPGESQRKSGLIAAEFTLGR